MYTEYYDRIPFSVPVGFCISHLCAILDTKIVFTTYTFLLYMIVYIGTIFISLYSLFSIRFYMLYIFFISYILLYIVIDFISDEYGSE